MEKSRSLLAVVAVVAVTLALAGKASATFPGKNGRIAFIKAVDNLGNPVGDIFTVNPDGRDVNQLTFFGSNTVGSGYEGWSPDGRQLVFAQFDVNTLQGQLWLVNADGTNPHLLLSDPSFDDGEPSFSPDGSQIAFFRCGPTDCAIYRMQADGSGLTVMAPFNFNPDVFNAHPAYSPDGRTIAFTSTTRDGALSTLYLANADGSNIRRLTLPEIPETLRLGISPGSCRAVPLRTQKQGPAFGKAKPKCASSPRTCSQLKA